MQSCGITLCRKCHYFIHKKYTEKELGRYFNTLEKLLLDKMIQEYVQWAKKQVD
ncbi:MAG: hypothetical protein OEZ34_14145 [Spirochaetia bacterium]|nr:hypothetical protein [Spirochaetia bacterium]